MYKLLLGGSTNNFGEDQTWTRDSTVYTVEYKVPMHVLYELSSTVRSTVHHNIIIMVISTNVEIYSIDKLLFE